MFTIEKIAGILSGMVIAAAQIIYLVNTIRRKVRPSVLSWLGWSFLMGTSVVSQVVGKGWQWSMTSILCSTIGCLTIGLVAFLNGNYSLERRDWRFIALGGACVCVYLVSGNPWVTTLFAIAADAALGIPTFLKAIGDPASERSAAWILGVISSALALMICLGHSWLYALFPAYLFLFNGAMAWLTQLTHIRSYKPGSRAR